MERKGVTRFVVEGSKGHIFVIDQSLDLTNNQVRITGAMDLSWVDTKIEDNLFVRELYKNTTLKMVKLL